MDINLCGIWIAKQCLLAFLLALYGTPLCAGDEFGRDFVRWAESNNMHPVAFAAIDSQGRTITLGGSVDPTEFAMPIASISKTIAGQCALHLSNKGGLSLDSTIEDYLGWSGPQRAVSVAQLLTHTSGFGPDSTQSDMLGRTLTDSARLDRVVEDVENRPLRSTDEDLFYYNNENYLLLEAVMRAALGEDAVSWCLSSVPHLAELKSLGTSQSTFALGFAGGLEISAYDLASFFHGLTVREDWPRVRLNGKNEYGPGIFIQTVSNGQNIFHLGGICVMFGPNIGAFAVRLANGNSIALLYSGCANDAEVSELNSLVLAHFRTSG